MTQCLACGLSRHTNHRHVETIRYHFPQPCYRQGLTSVSANRISAKGALREAYEERPASHRIINHM